MVIMKKWQPGSRLHLAHFASDIWWRGHIRIAIEHRKCLMRWKIKLVHIFHFYFLPIKGGVIVKNPHCWPSVYIGQIYTFSWSSDGFGFSRQLLFQVQVPVHQFYHNLVWVPYSSYNLGLDWTQKHTKENKFLYGFDKNYGTQAIMLYIRKE